MNRTMTFNKTLLALAIPLAMAGCSDSGGSSSSNEETALLEKEETALPEYVSFSGRVADGYLDGATVCLDINQNKQCDPTDPTTKSIAGGKFSIDDATQAQRDKFAVLVEVIVNSTIDEDNKAVALSKPLTLTAPAGYDFISPLSTMVQNNIEAGISTTDAEKIVQTKLGTTLALNSDYVAGKATGENTEEYARLHQVAQVTARVISNNMETLAEAAATNNIAIDNLITAIVNEVFDALADITLQVGQVTADANVEFDPDTLANNVDNALIDLNATNINDVVDQNEALANATVTDTEALLLREAVYGFEVEIDQEFQGSFYASYGLITKNQDLLAQPNHYEWNSSTNEFVATAEDPADADVVHILNSSGTWTRIPNFWDPTSFNGDTDGTFTVIRDRNGVSITQVFEMQEVNLAGLNVRTTLNKVDDGDGVWGNYLPATGVFPEGAKGYTFRLKNDVQNNDFYLMEDYDCNDAATRGGICNNSYVNSPLASNGLATSFNDFIVESAYTLTGDHNADAASIIGAEIAFDENYTDTYSRTIRAEILANKTVNLYSVAYNEQNATVELIGTSTWSFVPGSTVALEIEWIAALQEFDEYRTNRDNPVLAVISGYVRNARHEGVRPQPVEKADLPFLNEIAKNSAINGFSTN